MRLICPNCTAQYEVAENAIPENGRDVQCANCSHIWFQEPILFLDPVSKVETNLAPDYIPEPEPELAPKHQPVAPETQHFQSLIRNTEPPAQEPTPIAEFETDAPNEPLPEFQSVFGENRVTPAEPEPQEEPEQPAESLAPDEPETPPAPTASNSVLEVLRNEAAYVADQENTGETPKSDISFELPELDEPDTDEAFVEESPASNIEDEDTPTVESSIDDVEVATDFVAETSDDDEQEDDAISRMFDRISNAEEPEDPTIGGEDSAPEFQSSHDNIDDSAMDDASQDDPTLQPPEETQEAEQNMPAFVSTAAATAATKKTVDVASFIERLKSAEKTIDRTPAENAYHAAQDADVDADAMAEAIISQEPEPRDITHDTAKNQPSSDQAEAESGSNKVVAKGSSQFGDVDEIEGKIDLGADQAEAIKIESAAANEKIDLDGATKPSDTGGAFWNGFYAACIAVVLATLLYIFGPNLSASVPAMEDTVNGYTAAVDTGRMHVQNLYTEGGEPSLSNFATNTWNAITGR